MKLKAELIHLHQDTTNLQLLPVMIASLLWTCDAISSRVDNKINEDYTHLQLFMLYLPFYWYR
jgi:hypothetical protein